MARLFRPYSKDAPPAEPEIIDPVVEETPSKGPRKKGAPTPRRRDAERARLQRVNPQLTPKEAKKAASKANRERRMAALEARDATPEKQLMRDMVDARWNLGEFLLPAMMLMLALTFLQTMWPQATYVTLVLMYGFLALVLLDLALLWRRYKRLLAERHPGASTKGKGIMMYGWNRAIQMRRLRQPAPRIERGAKF
ncbi:DUF3043 domain-containing protein [Mariniluteicoccus flavus]